MRHVYRNRKGTVTQNCLFACSFSMLFTFCLTGWEGSATDARIFEDAQQHGFGPPPRKYFLADAGYPLCHQLLTPYRGVRYHLWEGAMLVFGIRYSIHAFDMHSNHWIGLKQKKSSSICDTQVLAMSLNASSACSNGAFAYFTQGAGFNTIAYSIFKVS